MLRHGVQKTAGQPSGAAAGECRKRAVAGKVAPLDNPGSDIACLPARAGLRLEGALAAADPVPPSRRGKGRLETRGARAPPWTFA